MSNLSITQLKKGVLDLCVLALLFKGDSYSYEISRELSDSVQVAEGTIYPLMRRLQTDGFVTSYLKESESGPSRKYYRITDLGREVFLKQKEEWMQFASEVHKVLGRVS